VAEGKIEKRYHLELRRYVRQIVDAVRYGNKFIIMGPREAKIELKKDAEVDKSATEKLVGIETADKMTARQFAAKVRKYLGLT
jgi:hypothetical protein